MDSLAPPLSQVADLEEELGRVSERLSETEAEAMSQQVGSKKCLIWGVLIIKRFHFLSPR